MDSRKRVRALAQCMALKSASRLEAQGEVLRAAAQERKAAIAREQADGATTRASGAWHAHLEASHFHPELAVALAGEVNRCVADAAEAQGAVEKAADARAACEHLWQARDAECRQVEALVHRSVHALARERERRSFDAIEDRVAYVWSRR